MCEKACGERPGGGSGGSDPVRLERIGLVIYISHGPPLQTTADVCCLFTAVGLQVSLDCLEKRFWAIARQVTCKN